MAEFDGGRRRPSVLSAESKWEIFVQVAGGQISQADEAARTWQVDVSTVIGIRRTPTSQGGFSFYGCGQRLTRRYRYMDGWCGCGW